MRRKEIQKIPFLAPPKKKKPNIVMKTAIHRVGGKNTLFIEVFGNRKEPFLRYVTNKEDWDSYLPIQETWSKSGFFNGPIEIPRWWHFVDYNQGRTAFESEEDEKRIRDYLKLNGSWHYCIEATENRIRSKRDEKKWKNRKAAIEERCKSVVEITDKELAELSRKYSRVPHRLYYKKRGNYADLICSACGKTTTGMWKDYGYYEDELRPRVDEPRNNHWGKCPKCGEYGIYHQMGRARTEDVEVGLVFGAERYKEDGAVIRYFELSKEFKVEKGPDGEILDIQEIDCGVELARCFIQKDKKTQMDYQFHDNFANKDVWKDSNLQGYGQMQIKEGKLLPGTMQNLKGTFLEYCAADAYQKKLGAINLIDYAQDYKILPQIEFLVKAGFENLAEVLVKKKRWGIIKDANAKNPADFLGIDKCDLECAKELKRDDLLIGSALNLLRVKHQKKLNWTGEQTQFAVEILRQTHLWDALNYMSIEQLKNRVEKYAGRTYKPDGNWHDNRRITQTAIMYIDYLNLRREAGYDMTNSIILHPRNLQEEHDKMVTEVNERRANERKREAMERYANIAKKYRKWRKLFYYESNKLFVRPAKSADEIVEEGRKLHHCVGGDTYLKRHAEGQSIICFLRDKETPDIPYITIEINPETMSIVQWYGAYDKKPNPEEVEVWLKGWLSNLRKEEQIAG